jgi:RNA-directed DNA polymerase
MTRSLPSHLFSTAEVVEHCVDAGIDNANIDSIRRYCNNLREKDLPILLDHVWLSQLLGWDEKTLYAVSACQSEFYHTYTIGKRSGSARKISEPLPTLKDIQSKILSYICEKIPVHKASYAYRKGNTIRKNARMHLRQKEILKLDIKDFFGSIKKGSVSRMFFDAGYTGEVSNLLARLCTLDERLAQGSPTSPAISNAVMREVDDILLSHFASRGMRYSRYSDDITISGDKIEDEHISYVSSILYNKKFYLNRTKTRVFRSGSSKIVTGVQVNTKLRAPSKLRKSLRAEVYFIEMYGLPSHSARKMERPSLCLRRIEGQLNFAIWLDPKDLALRNLKARLAIIRQDFNSLSYQPGF